MASRSLKGKLKKGTFKENMKRIRLNPVNQENDKLLQEIFQRMAANIKNMRAQNLVHKHIKDYRSAEDYLNDWSLIYQWHGAGQRTIEIISQFLKGFYQEYQTIVRGKHKETVVRLIAIDYPFLTNDELAFVASFLKKEGRYPVFFIANRYFQHTKKRGIQVFALAHGIVGGHRRFESIGELYGMTRERVRQLSVKSIVSSEDAGMTWNKERWNAFGFLGQSLLTEKNTHWDEIRQKEHIDNLDFFGALAIIRQMTPAPHSVVSMRADGRRANTHLKTDTSWQKPDILFAYDSRFECFMFEDALGIVGHEASLQRITDYRMSLSEFVDQHFTGKHSDEDSKAVVNIMREVLLQFDGVEIEDDDIVFRANRTNYMEEIYQILRRRGQAMAIDDIYNEFRTLHPDDHHTESKFIRSYMLRDNRFEAVGSTSIYQLREWNRFAGALGDLAVHLLEDRDEPVTVEALCLQMLEQRPTTTIKSCNTSIYLAVKACRLMFYLNTDSEGDFTPSNPEVSRYYVGFFDRQYPSQFWPVPLTVEGIVRSMRRFLEEYGRWPFSSGKTNLESTLYYVLRKYKNKRSITEEEFQHYQQAMSDINPNDYPANDRDRLYMNRCRELAEYCERHHHLPLSGKLLEWYQSQCVQTDTLIDFRRYHFEKLQAVIVAL